MKEEWNLWMNEKIYNPTCLKNLHLREKLKKIFFYSVLDRNLARGFKEVKRGVAICYVIGGDHYVILLAVEDWSMKKVMGSFLNT